MRAAQRDSASVRVIAPGRRPADASGRNPEPCFRTLVHYASDVITILDETGVVRYENPAIERVLGYHPTELLGTDPFTLIHDDDVAQVHSLFEEVVRQPGWSASARFRFRHKNGSWRWMEVIGTNLLADPGVRGVIINSRDVTDRQLAEARLRESEQQHRELLAAARRQTQEMSLLEEVRSALARELELPSLFRTVVEAVARTFGYTLVSLYLLEDDVLVLQHQVGYEREFQRIPVTDGIAGQVARTGEPVLLEDVRDVPAFLGAIDGIVSELCVPLRDQGEPVGILNLESTGDVPLTEADLNLMLALTEHVNVALGRARLYTEVRRNETRFRALVQHTADMISVVDRQGNLIYASPAYERILGYRPDELVGRPIDAIAHSDDGLDGRFFADLARRRGGLDQFEARVHHRNGSTRWLEVVATNLLDDPSVGGIVVTSRDITERKAAEAERGRRERHAALRMEVSTALAERGKLPGMLQRCAEAIVRHLDAAFARVWLLDEEEQTLDLRASAGLYTHLDGGHSRIAVGERKIGRIAQRGQPYLTNDVANDLQIDGDWARREGMVAFAGYPLLVEHRLVGVMALFARHPLAHDTLEALGATADIMAQAIERKAFEAQLWHQAHHDPLTGLPNRTLFLERLAKVLQRTQSRRGVQAVPLLFLDLDGFKVVNDSLGHAVGDRLLIGVAERLAAQLRTGDVISRFGGDEFAVLLTGCTAPDAAVHVARRLVTALMSPFELDGHEAVVTASIGIVDSPEIADASDLLRAADVALYRAKASGKGTIAVFDSGQDGSALARLDRETALRRALERDELRVAYQPIMHLATGTVVGVEALARWEHPERGLLLPDEFIPLAEETGLIVPVGQWLRAEACRQVRAWNSRLPADGAWQLSVNLSAREFRQPGLVAELAHTLKVTGLLPRNLILEITESVTTTDADVAIATMRQIKDLGMRLSLDDFGTGYASLSALRRLPLDELKVDRSFVAGLGQHHEDTAIVRASIGVARALGLCVTAEGVETAEQAAQLRELACERGQGRFFAPPCTAQELDSLLRNRLIGNQVIEAPRDLPIPRPISDHVSSHPG